MIQHRQHSFPLLAASVALAGLQGCATKISVQEIPVDLAPGNAVNGLPFLSPGRFALDVYKLGKNGKYEQLETTTTADTLADPYYLYLLQIEGQPLSQGTVTAKLNLDGTIDTVKVASSSKAPEALTELGTGIKSVADAQTASKKADAAKQTAADTATVDTEDRVVAALQAKNDAVIAALELEALDSTASAVARRTAEQKVEKARLIANQKARRAGLDAPFPAVEIP